MRGFRIFLVLILIFWRPTVSFSQAANKSSLAKIDSITSSFLKKQAGLSKYSILKMERQASADGSMIYLVKLNPVGFLIISPSSTVPVLAFSFKNNYGELPFQQTFTRALFRSVSLLKPVSSTQKQTTAEKTWGPFIQTLWGQVNCYDKYNNLINVTNYYTPHHYAAGCVAISMSTILHYYRWPLRGVSSTTYTDNRGSSQGTYTADYGNTEYDWENMLDRYKYRSSTDVQRQAAGLLVYHVAISLHMDFEYNGSTSNVNKIPAAANLHFRFSGLERSPSSSLFWTFLDRNLSHSIPVVFAVKNDKGVGHAIVCDGLKIDEDSVYYYHLNMGWWGTSNGWYRIHDTWNAGSYNTITDGIFFLLPSPYVEVPYIKSGDKKVTVFWRFPDKIKVDAFEIQQKIDDGDWTTLSNELSDTTYPVDVQPSHNQYFRVRAKIDDRWPFDGWSNVEQVTLDVTGIKDNTFKNNIVLGPNPASEVLNIHFGMKIPTSFVVYNAYGQSVLHGSYQGSNPNYLLNIGFLHSGIYFIRFVDNNRHVSTMKFVKQ